MTPPRDELLSCLRNHVHVDALAARVNAVLGAAMRQRSADFLTGVLVSDATFASLPVVAQSDADTQFGNVLQILDAGARTSTEWLVLSALLAKHFAATLVTDGESPDSFAAQVSDLCWLAQSTPCNPFAFLDAWCESADRARLWDGLKTNLAAVDLPRAGRVQALLGLCFSESHESEAPLLLLLEAVQEPLLLSVFEARLVGEPLQGEWLPPPRSALTTTLMALSGWLFLRSVWRLIARYVLGLKSRANLKISPRGLELSRELSLLGKRLRTEERFVPLGQVVSLEREQRFRGALLHLGLLALSLGTFFGTGLVIDGLRVPGGSPRLMAMGAAMIALGILLDLLLSHLPLFNQARVRLVVRSAKNPPWIIESRNPDETDRALERLKACCSVRS